MKAIILSVLIISFVVFLYGSTRLTSELDFWGRMGDEDAVADFQTGFRWTPSLQLRGQDWGIWYPKVQLDADFRWQRTQEDATMATRTDAEFYRWWAGLMTPQFELRGGLQQLNFGPAQLLRNLRWFDNIDPRDPQKRTRGVTGFLGRYYFLDNTNIWLWGILGEDNPKGLELWPSRRDHWEFGGRLQLPLLAGEVGTAYHVRSLAGVDVDEHRFGLDGRWDPGVGLWFEAMTVLTGQPEFPVPGFCRRQVSITIGSDYTFAWGNGLHILGEHAHSGISYTDEFGENTRVRVTALSADYPFGMLDTVILYGFWDWDAEALDAVLSWRRMYDYLSVYLDVSLTSRDNNEPESGFEISLRFVYNM